MNKSLYVLRQAPVKFFELVKGNLSKLGFKQIKGIGPCLFIHPEMNCLSYVDDCLWFSAKPHQMDDMIEELGKIIILTVEGNDVSAFLEIQFKQVGTTIEVIQVGLIDRMKHTPAGCKPPGSDKHGQGFKKDWSYSSVVGMLLYLASKPI
jgi:Reverse transcriptase (RNA-dependent DNA polymerase)